MMSREILQFINCRILRDHKIIKEDLWVRNGVIINPEKVFFDEKMKAHVKINCKGAIIAAGFIDLQINGGFGIDFSNISENTKDKVDRMSKGLLQFGITSYCPTMVTSPIEVYHNIVPKIKRTSGGKHGATILGLHLEGPFINVLKKGAHPPECIKSLSKGMETLLEVYGELDNVAIITLAPELEKTEDVIKKLVSKNIVVSVGHSTANLVEGEIAVKHGANLITHLFNAMLPFHHRDPGLVGLLTSDSIPKDKIVYFGIIADGIHTHPAALRIAHRAHPNGLILVTDAISAMGLEEGKHNIGQFEVEIRDSKAFVAGTDTLCGSIATMNQCVQLFKKATGCSTEYALEAASLHPALAMGISARKGSLDFECDADLVFLDDDLNLISTWIAGECVYEKEISV